MSPSLSLSTGRLLARNIMSIPSRPRCVLLNAARLDFDGRIDFGKLEAVADVTR